MKTYLVVVKASRTVLVQAEDTEHAEEQVSEECTSTDWDVEEHFCECEIKTKEELQEMKETGAVTIEDWM